MSKGTPHTALRLSAEVLDLADVTIRRRNLNSKRPPWSLTEFIRVAIQEKVKKMERSRRPRSQRGIAIRSADDDTP